MQGKTKLLNNLFKCSGFFLGGFGTKVNVKIKNSWGKYFPFQHKIWLISIPKRLITSGKLWREALALSVRASRSAVYILLILHASSVTDGCSLPYGPACLSLARSVGPNGRATDRTAWSWTGPLSRARNILTGPHWPLSQPPVTPRPGTGTDRLARLAPTGLHTVT